MEKRTRLILGFLGLLLGLVGLIVWNVNAGSVPVSPGEIVSILLGRGGDNAVIVGGIRHRFHNCAAGELAADGGEQQPETAAGILVFAKSCCKF